MYAIIKTGGKQYRVQKGDVINVEKIVPKRKNQKKVTFDEVLFVNEDGNMLVGAPLVEGYKVEGKILEQGKSEKVIIYKYKAKKDYRRKQGHRQPYTQIEITGLVKKEEKVAE